MLNLKYASVTHTKTILKIIMNSFSFKKNQTMKLKHSEALLCRDVSDVISLSYLNFVLVKYIYLLHEFAISQTWVRLKDILYIIIVGCVEGGVLFIYLRLIPFIERY
jgi:hypothetical protein